MTAEQVLRCALIKQTHQFSYQKLTFHLADSQFGVDSSARTASKYRSLPRQQL